MSEPTLKFGEDNVEGMTLQFRTAVRFMKEGIPKDRQKRVAPVVYQMLSEHLARMTDEAGFTINEETGEIFVQIFDFGNKLGVAGQVFGTFTATPGQYAAMCAAKVRDVQAAIEAQTSAMRRLEKKYARSVAWYRSRLRRIKR